MFWDDHTFVICAYRESRYLEDCIRSVMGQKIKSHILITTSTPNEHILGLAKKYHIPCAVNPHPSSIYGDWNFGKSQVKTRYFTIAHQDDLYKPEYSSAVRNGFASAKNPLLFFCDYAELRGDTETEHSLLLNVKKLMLAPLRIGIFQKSRWMRRRILALGNPICCPAVSYCMDHLKDFSFSDRFRCDLDWDAWERISRMPGEFIYCSRVLMDHRIHEESATTELIENSVRYQEDLAMYRRFWPQWMAELLMKYYSKSQDSNQMKKG